SLVHGCHHASITTVRGGRLTVRVATDGTAQRADELQDELDEGPSLQAVRTGHSVVAHELSTETRWTDWCSAAVDELDVTAALSVLLVSRLRPLATLNLYSDTVEGLSSLDIAQLHTLAAPLADAMLDERVGTGRLGPAA
ncbi:MAG: GAF domain-containing protein, partial [Janthinobacterium lividum]